MLGAGLGWIFLHRIKHSEEPGGRYRDVERVFAVMVVLTACAVAFAHGSNDVANAIGPLAAVVQVVREGSAGAQAPVEPWMLIVGGVGIVVASATMGYRVMDTVGRNITELTPSRGFRGDLRVRGDNRDSLSGGHSRIDHTHPGRFGAGCRDGTGNWRARSAGRR